jgi:uncharacterized membrane protein
LRSTTRLEAFADAVLAIAFTLSIVELKIPSAGPGYGSRLMELWPSYLGFGLSALVIGIYWVNHHFSGAIYRTAGHWFLLATLLFSRPSPSSPFRPAPLPSMSRMPRHVPMAVCSMRSH